MSEREGERESDVRCPECQRAHGASHKATCKAERKEKKEEEEAVKEAVVLQCAKCSKTGESLLKCSGCGVAFYCSAGTCVCVCEREREG